MSSEPELEDFHYAGDHVVRGRPTNFFSGSDQFGSRNEPEILLGRTTAFFFKEIREFSVPDISKLCSGLSKTVLFEILFDIVS